MKAPLPGPHNSRLYFYLLIFRGLDFTPNISFHSKKSQMIVSAIKIVTKLHMVYCWYQDIHTQLHCVLVSEVSEVAQSCPTLCDPMDCSLPGSSVHGIFEARVLEWVAISFSRGSTQMYIKIALFKTCNPLGSSLIFILYAKNIFFKKEDSFIFSLKPFIG